MLRGEMTGLRATAIPQSCTQSRPGREDDAASLPAGLTRGTRACGKALPSARVTA